MWRIGMKVGCVRDDFDTRDGEACPQKGSTYTIRGIRHHEGGVYLLVAEIINAPRDYLDGRYECAFTAKGFRPLVTRSTDTGFSILEDVRRSASAPVKQHDFCGNED